MQKQNIEIIKDIKTVLEFYQAMGIERIPLNIAQKCRSAEVQKPPPHPPLGKGGRRGGDYSKKVIALKALRDEIGDCQRCKLSKGRKNIVFGEGSVDAEIMFIGEGPGEDEDLQGRPFVGRAGQLLTKLIEKMGFKREDVYIGNIVKCRPPFNRVPEEDEISACSPFIRKQAGIISPKVIVSLGRISTQTLIGTKIPIGKLRGKFYQFENIPLMPTFHPSYLLRNPKDKWLVWEDAQKVLERLKK
ncbi:MAG: uracil-DNA glycosylase [Nitrospirae bacterium CG_4_10_14_3_um_filter_44_29]|nr:uracil-DNA glycosylase [Nitrospirota bacterium]PIV40013.1 MAG: uracil-DNA glycosylase [Nitrospirae bacterium CG02_land_8_20_14_3_00_44_33]PIV66033.1 MAG: uracil-DNA glycosylase [Nitrospirae bacterium CG01_land_8_20_14_3_00_44_22]PIW90078.1 MAG: uracil-DNA glycosylase [Nitrospirae bacterium CG_4_8_14_3_um_filter_44_28]PIX88229.1 MAG: uracil-DNA glycosylase [Nitrospirae bacterium CG_4_10_14_3_um_filter_44_29]PJA82059.1 MAG: uracil-DNA glycosylase [Nitrospirae bacterium CG_4_9_14_3_um_filter_4